MARKYFTVVIIYESNLDIKYKNKIPPLIPTLSKLSKPNEPKTEAKTEIKNEPIYLENIFVKKALCFSSLVPFPSQTKSLIGVLLNYFKDNHYTNGKIN